MRLFIDGSNALKMDFPGVSGLCHLFLNFYFQASSSAFFSKKFCVSVKQKRAATCQRLRLFPFFLCIRPKMQQLKNRTVNAASSARSAPERIQQAQALTCLLLT